MIKRDELTKPGSCMSRARDDEMTFVLLARDPAAPNAIRAWATERIAIGKNMPGDGQIVEALACADAMVEQRALVLAEEYRKGKAEALRRGWKVAPERSVADEWHEAWLRYWQAMGAYECQLAAGVADPGRPVAPHRSGGAS